MSIVAVESGRPIRPVVEATVGETQVANWREFDGRIAAVRRTLRAATLFNPSSRQNTPYLLGEFAASDQKPELQAWLNLDSMLVVDHVDNGVPSSSVFVRVERQLFGSVPFGQRRELYTADPDGGYSRQPRAVRQEAYGSELVLEPGSMITLFTRKPGPETYPRYNRRDAGLVREFEAVSSAVHFKG